MTLDAEGNRNLMEEWARHIESITCLQHGDSILTDGLAVAVVVAWLEHHAAIHGEECDFKSKLSPYMGVVEKAIPRQRRTIVLLWEEED